MASRSAFLVGPSKGVRKRVHPVGWDEHRQAIAFPKAGALTGREYLAVPPEGQQRSRGRKLEVRHQAAHGRAVGSQLEVDYPVPAEPPAATAIFLVTCNWVLAPTSASVRCNLAA